MVQASRHCTPFYNIALSSVENGCILGNPYVKPGEKVFIPGISQLEVRTREAISKTPQKLALRHLDVYFFPRKKWLGVTALKQKAGNFYLKRLLMGFIVSACLLCTVTVIVFTLFFFPFSACEFQVSTGHREADDREVAGYLTQQTECQVQE